ncbi:hypothetical protein BGX33_005248, partial [Mortierella sp. NVP41]
MSADQETTSIHNAYQAQVLFMRQLQFPQTGKTITVTFNKRFTFENRGAAADALRKSLAQVEDPGFDHIKKKIQ